MEPVQTQLTLSMENRWKKFFDPKILIMASALHPFIKLHWFSEYSVTWTHIFDWAEMFYKQLFKKDHQTLLPEIRRYRDEEGLFARERVNKWKCSMEFWLFAKAEAPELSALALMFSRVLPHSAAIERTWSIMTNIHTKSRNRLLPNKVLGLARVKMEIIAKRKAEVAEKSKKRPAIVPTDTFSDIEVIGETSDAEGNVFALFEDLIREEEIDVDESGDELMDWLRSAFPQAPSDGFFTLEMLFGNKDFSF